MKKTCALLLFLILLLQIPHAFAEEKLGPIMKLNRGIANVLTSPLEYLVEFDRLKQDHDPGTALIGGIFYGTVMTAARIATGAFEILTFPLPIPADYQSIMQPPTAWEDFNKLNKK